MKILTDRKFRVARKWSNKELKRFAHLFTGDVVNVSAWRDQDKEGNRYRNYFVNASSYHHTNFDDGKGISHLENEYFCDLAKELPLELEQRFDVVYNHTTLEHIYDCRTAFRNICKMSKDIVILVVPFSQIHHGSNIPDYWRFTPQGMDKLFEENGLDVIYASWNNHRNSAVYLFYIASKNIEKWRNFEEFQKNPLKLTAGKRIGNTIKDNVISALKLVKRM